MVYIASIKLSLIGVSESGKSVGNPNLESPVVAWLKTVFTPEICKVTVLAIDAEAGETPETMPCDLILGIEIKKTNKKSNWINV